MKSLYLSGSIVAASIALLSTPATAQDAADDGRYDNQIIVTAQKRTQTLAEIPQSISVLGGEKLEQQQATSFVDYVAQVPGLSLQQSDPGKTRIILRGINTGGASPTAAVYIDDTPFGPSTGQSNGAVLAGDIDTFDIERIEVLRGPQGTLYGANSLGGLLKFVTVAPKLSTFEGRVKAGYEMTEGGDDGWSANGVINVPLGDTIALRASGYYRTVGGYIDTLGIERKDANDFDSFGGRASLLFEPVEDLSVRLTAIAQNIRSNSRASFDVDPQSLKPLDFDPTTGDPIEDGRRTHVEYYPERNDVDYRLYNGTLEWNLGPATVTSVTSYGTLDQTEVYDASYQLPGVADAIFGGPDTDPLGITFPAFAGQKKFTQELRLDSQSNDTFEWLIGGYYTKEKGRLFQQYQPFVLTTGEALDPALTLPVGEGGADVTFPYFLTATLASEYEEYAAFGSATVYLSPAFDITAGARYSHNKQDTMQALDGSYLALVGFPLEGIPDVVTGKSSENVFTWSVAPRFEISDQTTVYARVAKGYRPGGPNVVPPGADDSFPSKYEADTLVSYEVGVRAQTPDRTFAFDASVYYLDWKDIQVLVTYDTNIGPVSADGNGESATSKGAEVSATVRPIRGLDIALNFAYNDATLDEDLPAGNGGFAGDRLPYAPELSANVSADYEWEVGAASTAYIGGSIRLVGDQVGNFDNAYQTTYGQRYEIDGYASADLRAGLTFDRFNIGAYVRNVTNSGGFTSVDGFLTRPGTALNATSIRPRTFGVTVGADF